MNEGHQRSINCYYWQDYCPLSVPVFDAARVVFEAIHGWERQCPVRGLPLDLQGRLSACSLRLPWPTSPSPSSHSCFFFSLGLCSTEAAGELMTQFRTACKPHPDLPNQLLKQEVCIILLFIQSKLGICLKI